MAVERETFYPTLPEGSAFSVRLFAELDRLRVFAGVLVRLVRLRCRV
jgi:hypothetical protein